MPALDDGGLSARYGGSIWVEFGLTTAVTSSDLSPAVSAPDYGTTSVTRSVAASASGSSVDSPVASALKSGPASSTSSTEI